MRLNLEIGKIFPKIFYQRFNHLKLDFLTKKGLN